MATTVSGIGGALGFALFHDASAPIFVTWQNWFASDALGIVTIAPLVIGLASAARDPPTRSEAIEGVIALALLVVMSVIVIALPQEPWSTIVPIALLFPVLLWIAARCRPVFAAAAVFIVTLAIVVTTTIGIGHFGGPGLPMAQRVLAARAGILAVALCAYVLAALFAERRQHAAALAESEARVQEALTAGAVTTFVWDVGTGLSQRSTNAAQILGLDPRANPARATFSRACMRTTASDSGRWCAMWRPSVRPIPPPSASSTPMAGSSGSRKSASAEFDAVGRLLRLKGLTLDVTARKRAEDQQSLLIAALDHRVKNLLARVAVVAKDMRREQRLHSTSTYGRSIGAFNPWPMRTRCSAKIAGTASVSPTSSAGSWRPTRRMQTRSSAVRTSSSPPRRPRRSQWCCMSWSRTLQDTARCRPRMGGWR